MKNYRESHLVKGAIYDQGLEDLAFDSYMAAREQQFLEKTVPALFPQGVPAYLDFACGTGRITSVVEKFANRSFGVDVSDSMQAVAKGKCSKTQFFLQDMTAAPLDIGPVNLVTAFRFFGNAENDLRVAAMNAIARQLQPGGYLIINNHRNPSSLLVRLAKLRGATDPADLSPARLDGLLHQAGFTVTRIHAIAWWHIHHRLDRKSIFDSSLAALIDPISRLPGLYRYCPDYIVVARKN